jgi:laminin G domain protein
MAPWPSRPRCDWPGRCRAMRDSHSFALFVPRGNALGTIVKCLAQYVVLSSPFVACNPNADLGGATFDAQNAGVFDATAPAVDATAPAVDVTAPAVDVTAPAVDVTAPAVDTAPDEPDSPACIGSLSNIGTADFHISFTVKTSQAGFAALVSQRKTCLLGDYWDVRMADGHIQVETDDTDGANHWTQLCAAVEGSDAGRCTSVAPANLPPPVNDGQPHRVVISRSSGSLQASVDALTSSAVESQASFGSLSPVAIGSDPCEGVDGTVAFTGTLTNLCLSTP